VKDLRDEPDMIAAINRDIAAMGLIGEESNAVLVHLGYTSRVCDDPVAIIARGSSGSGKDTLLRRVARLFPPESKIEALDATKASWFNTEPDYFKHKIFLAGERSHAKDDAAKDDTKYLRQMLSEKRISRRVSVDPDPNTRRWDSETVVRHGPIAYAETTTLDTKSIFEEDLNRMIQVHLDDSPEQTRKIMLSKADKYAPDGPALSVNEAEIIARHHAFQRTIQGCKVGIPYGKLIAERMPDTKPAVRRSMEQVLTVIECLVVLQQHRRKLNKQGLRIATIEDYVVAYSLLEGPLQAALGAGPDYDKAKKLRAALKTATTFTAKDVKAVFKFKHTEQANNLCRSFADAGLVDQLNEPKRGSPAEYEWAEDSSTLLAASILPSVEEVRRFLMRRSGVS
jgi:hypothetical protein